MIDLTLVIAGIGTDGIVLASDRAETSNSAVKMVSKIYHLKNGNLFSFAGDLGVAQKIIDAIESLDIDDNEPLLSRTQRIEDLTVDLNRRYKKKDASVHFFLTMRDNNNTIIQFFDDDGTSLRIENYDTIGNGSTYAAFFLKQLYSADLTTEELSEIFSFTIQLVGQSELNLSVKVNQDFPPEIYIIQSGKKPYQYNNEFLWNINEDRIRSLNGFIGGLFNSERTLPYLEVAKRYW